MDSDRALRCKRRRKSKSNRPPHFLVYFLSSLIILFTLVSGQKFDGGDSTAAIAHSDHQALTALKQAFADPRGVLSSWNESGSGACSGWTGIKCVGGRVVAIQLPWKGLGGQISEKIGQLQSLRRISLHDNSLVGPFPASLGFLPNLRGVYLFNNRLSGSIPPSIGNCPVLTALDVSNNRLAGALPSSLANSTRLYRLNLSFNGFSGNIPVSLTRSISLTFLALDHNNLSGSVPDSWGGPVGKLKNGPFNLRSLSLDHNLLSGEIPSSLGKLTMLENLNLSHNQIEGPVPDRFLTGFSRLSSIDLSNNDINGTLPGNFFDLSSLVSVNLESNNLEGQIPESMEKLQNLSVLNMADNKFTGKIPDSIGKLSALTFLDLSENNFTGEIPGSLSDSPSLSFLDVSYNDLSGPVPSSLARKFNSTSFVGNVHLCGYAGSSPCPSSRAPTANPSPPGSSTNHGPHRKLSTKDIILIAAGCLLIALLVLCCVLLCCLLRKRSKGRNGKLPPSAASKAIPVASEGESGNETGGKLVHFDGPFVFTADDLLCATAEIMGKGSYGTAYKATLEDGNQVAVKRLREKITKTQKEFEAEVAELGRIRHRNILALRAYYMGPKGEKLLVYDYMPNGSLASFLHARGPETSITWATRMSIATGVTRGLCYLHGDEKIVHGNLTSSNVLLDEQTNPKIADVGLSKLMTGSANTSIVATAGKTGYRAPELARAKNVGTAKADVYSLGVIILELLTGKSPSEEANEGLDLPRWVSSIVKEEWTNEVFDVEIMREASNDGEEMLDALKVALHCVDPVPSARPEAHEVLRRLEEIKPEAAAATAAKDDDGDAAT